VKRFFVPIENTFFPPKLLINVIFDMLSFRKQKRRLMLFMYSRVSMFLTYLSFHEFFTIFTNPGVNIMFSDLGKDMIRKLFLDQEVIIEPLWRLQLDVTRNVSVRLAMILLYSGIAEHYPWKYCRLRLIPTAASENVPPSSINKRIMIEFGVIDSVMPSECIKLCCMNSNLNYDIQLVICGWHAVA
jgi:hypothetical protein